MDETDAQSVDPLLIKGKTVRNAARPEWGNGTVTTVLPTTVNGKRLHRVTVQFLLVGRKTLMAEIVIMRERRMSFPKIAAALTERGVPTKSGNGKKWNQATIRGILKRLEKTQ